MLDKKKWDLGRFSNEVSMSVYCYKQINYTFGKVCNALEAAEISLIPFKGSVILKYYSEPLMRTIYDIYILIQKEDIE